MLTRLPTPGQPCSGWFGSSRLWGLKSWWPPPGVCWVTMSYEPEQADKAVIQLGKAATLLSCAKTPQPPRTGVCPHHLQGELCH